MFARLLPGRWVDGTTVRQQTAALTGLLCIATVAVVTVGAAWLARREAVHHASLDLTAMARTMAARLDQNMFERYREIRNVVDLEPLRPVWHGDPGTTRGVLAQLQSTLEDYAWLGFATTDGTVRAATRGMLEGVSVARRPWFIAGLKGPAVEDVHDAKLLDSLLTRGDQHVPFRFVDVAMPVKDGSGSTIGVLGAHLSWHWASEVRAEVLARHDSGSRSEIWVLSQQGEVLLGPKAAVLSDASLAQARLGREATFVDRSGDRPMLTALVATRGQGDYPGLGWIVASRRPVDVALGPADRLVLVIGLLGLLVAALGAGLAWLLAGTVTNPLTRLCRSIDLVGRDPSAGIEHQHGSRDVLRLSAAIRSLLRRLGTAERVVREIQETIHAVEARAQEQLRAADETTRRLDSDLHTLRKLADSDPLTGLSNRRAFLPLAEDAMNHYRRHRRDLCVLMIDIDHFKQVNDRFGHAAGDEIIREVGRLIAGQIRTTDKVARFGGEEFIVLLRETDQAGAELLADRIRESIATRVAPPSRETISITISVGGAMAQPNDRDIEDVIARADSALYIAKSIGRNRVVMAARAPALSDAA